MPHPCTIQIHSPSLHHTTHTDTSTFTPTLPYAHTSVLPYARAHTRAYIHEHAHTQYQLHAYIERKEEQTKEKE